SDTVCETNRQLGCCGWQAALSMARLLVGAVPGEAAPCVTGSQVTGMRRPEHSLLANTGALIVCGLLAGIMVAAVAFPAVAVSGLAAKVGAESFDKLPADLDVVPPPQISYVYASDGTTLLAMLYDENRRDVKLTDVAQVMQHAIIASEDARFYE